MQLQIENLARQFPSPRGDVLALQNLTFSAAHDEFLCIVGPSGCGKSTLLRLVAGLLSPSAGSVVFDGWPRPPRCAMVFQDAALFRWLTVQENVAFGLETRGIPAVERLHQAQALLERMGLGDFAGHYPAELSGGMRQRAAIARALLIEPDVLLMDEPFRALDAQTRFLLQEELLRLWREQPRLVLFVTHDIEEALLLGQRVLVMSGRPGQILAEVAAPAAAAPFPQPGSQPEFEQKRLQIWQLLEPAARQEAARSLPAPEPRRGPDWRLWLAPLAIGLALLAAWETGARAGLASALFFPAPSVIIAALAAALAGGPLLGDLVATLYRLALGLALGGSLGYLAGLWLGWSRRARLVLGPFVAAVHPLPKLALLPLALILFGIGEAPKVILIALTAFFPLLVNTMVGVQQIEAQTWEVARHYNARGWTLLRRVIWPASLPMALAGMQLALNAALMVTVAVEMVSAAHGLGASIWLAWQTLRIEEMYAVLIVIAGLGLASNLLLYWLGRLLMPWQSEENHP